MEPAAPSRGLHRGASPTGFERPFSHDELFYSTTDDKGIITAGNETFARVAAYELDVMVGRPHNLIRHPDMPRGAFRLLWDYLDAGRPVAAYVKNLAADGGHYWVLAYVAPIDGGFLSIRLKPGTAYFDAAHAVYEQLRAFERELEHDVARRKELIVASRDRLLGMLADAGFESYDAFMQAALPAEVAHRAEHMREAGHSTSPPRLEPWARRILADCDEACSQLTAVSARLSGWAGVTEQLRAHGATMAEVADDIELFSLNAQIAATRLGGEGAALLAVAGLLSRQAAELRPAVEAQVVELDRAARLLGGVGSVSFAAAVSRLQLDMLRSFVISASARGGHDVDEHLQLLATALETGARGLVDVIDELQELLASIDASTTQVRRGMDRLRALEVNGRIESTRVDGTGNLGAMFSEIGDHVRAATGALEAIDVAAITGTEAAHRVLDVVQELGALVGDHANVAAHADDADLMQLAA
jgi:aerotaxis receptor